MAIESNLAGVYRVAYEAVTGEFNRDTDEAARNYVASNEKMSDSAIRLEHAQDRLRRAVAKGPAASREQQRALLQLRQAERDVRAETDRTTRSVERQDRALAGLSKRGSGLGGLARGATLYASAFLGAGGVVYALKQALDVSSNLNEQTDKTKLVFGSAAGQVERYAKNALGLANDEALDLVSTFGALLRPIGLVGKASADLSTDLVKRGVDLSSFYNRDVKEAIEAVRSGIVGEAEPLRSFGVRLSETRVQALALQQTGKDSIKQLTDEEKVRARVAIIFKDSSIAANNYRNTLGGVANQEKEAASNARDTQAAIGQALTPAWRNLLGVVNEYLGDAENQRRLQEQVNSAVETGGKVLRGLKEGLELVRAAAEPVVDALGGIENAAKLALIVGVVSRVRRAATSFGLLQASSASTAAKGVRDATIFGRAWDVATRPRTMVVTTTTVGGGLPTPGQPRGRNTPTPVPTPRGRFGLPPILGSNPALITAGVILATPGASGASAKAGDINKYPRVAALARRIAAGKPYTAAERAAIDSMNFRPGTTINMLTDDQLSRLNAALAPQRVGAEGGDRDRPNMGRAIDRTPRPGARGGTTARGEGRPRRTMLDIATDLSRALTTPGTADEERLYAEQITRYRAQIAQLEKRKTLTDEQKGTLQRLYGDLGAAQSSLESIEEQRENAIDQRREERQRRARARAAKRKAAAKRAAQEAQKRKVEEAEQEAAINAPPDLKHIAKIAGMRADAMARAYGLDPDAIRERDDARRKRAKTKEPDSLTREELGGIFRDFLTGWGEMVDAYYSNVAGGSVSTTTLEHLTREQTNVLRDGLTRPRAGFRDQLDEAVMLG